jgi:hypothetical protein
VRLSFFAQHRDPIVLLLDMRQGDASSWARLFTDILQRSIRKICMTNTAIFASRTMTNDLRVSFPYGWANTISALFVGVMKP